MGGAVGSVSVSLVDMLQKTRKTRRVREQEERNRTYAQLLCSPARVANPAYGGHGGEHENGDDDCTGGADHVEFILSLLRLYFLFWRRCMAF